MALMLALAARAQPFLVTIDGNNQSRVGDTYDYGKVAAGDIKDVLFGACNTGNVPPTVRGVGFSISAVYGYVPGQCLRFTVRFSATQPDSYSAGLYSTSLQVNTINVFLLALVLPAPSLTVFPVCTVDSQRRIDFGSVPAGTLRLCNFSLQNLNAQPLVIATIAATGAFQGPQNLPTPFTLAPQEAKTFTIQVTPACGTNSLSGTLIVNTQNYTLTGTSFVPALPKPTLTFDSNNFASGQQHLLTMNLPAQAPCGADGSVGLTFVPAASAVTDDPTIVFVAVNKRTVPFHVNPGSTQVLLNGQPSVVFATGSTAGKIGFTINGDTSTTLAIPPATISIDTATASNQRLGNLDIEIIGYDNTYTAGAMSFAFLDTGGKPIGLSAISADFTSAFKTYFTNQKSGSSFLMRVSFPVTGDQKQVASVQVTLTNAAGQSQTGALTFQ